MSDYALTILYVDNPLASAEFYTKLFGVEPIDGAPTFAMFPLKKGVALGLWSKHSVQPPPRSESGCAEVAFTVHDYTAVDSMYANWTEQQVVIEQAPVELDFGRTFVGLDPDGHRLRMFAPNGR